MASRFGRVGAFGRAALLLATAFVFGLPAAAASEPLRDHFLHPPISAQGNALAVEVANTPNNALIDPKKVGFKSLKPVAAGWVGPATLHAER